MARSARYVIAQTRDHCEALRDCLLRGSVGMWFPYGFPNALSSAPSGIPTASVTSCPFTDCAGCGKGGRLRVAFRTRCRTDRNCWTR